MKIRFLTSASGDWIGLYIDGELIAEGHDFGELFLTELLLPNADIKSVEDTEGKFLNDYTGRCPVTYPFDD